MSRPSSRAGRSQAASFWARGSAVGWSAGAGQPEEEFEATPENYEAVNEKIGDAVPEGLILHTVSDLGGDKWKLVDVWESAENFQNFVQNQLIPAIAEVDPDAPQAPEPEIREIHTLRKS
jgi:hypothetical protein